MRVQEMCSHVVMFASIRKEWNVRRQKTMIKKTAISNRPIRSTMLGSKIVIPCTPSRKKAASSSDWKTKKQ